MTLAPLRMPPLSVTRLRLGILKVFVPKYTFGFVLWCILTPSKYFGKKKIEYKCYKCPELEQITGQK